MLASTAIRLALPTALASIALLIPATVGVVVPFALLALLIAGENVLAQTYP